MSSSLKLSDELGQETISAVADAAPSVARLLEIAAELQWESTAMLGRIHCPDEAMAVDSFAIRPMMPETPTLTVAARKAAAFIRKHPEGVKADDVAAAKICTAEHFRKLWPTLEEMGFRKGTSGRGYYPPADARSP